MKGIAGLLKHRNELHLVCAGKRGFSDVETTFFRNLGIENKIICLVKTTDSELAWLYAKAIAFVFPSLNEGFGIPILEAWSCETPVVLSDNACFREIAAEAGAFFNPHSEDSIRETVDRVVSDKILRKELVEKGTRRLQFFSWEKTVNQTYKLYKALL